MNVIANHNDLYILNLARGEELCATLLSFCKEKQFAGATVSGLGAGENIDLAYYNLTTKTYEHHRIDERVEIVSLTGNLGTLNSEKMLHMHGVFGKADLSTIGGHIFSLVVSGACEIHLTALPVSFTRRHDEATGLNLLCESRH